MGVTKRPRDGAYQKFASVLPMRTLARRLLGRTSLWQGVDLLVWNRKGGKHKRRRTENVMASRGANTVGAFVLFPNTECATFDTSILCSY